MGAAAEPLILAVESATAVVGAALLRGERVLAERTLAAGPPASETLLPAIDAVLAQAGAALDEIEGFAVSIGPGSFTGLRVGLATVKGLAFAPPRPVVPVCTLAALAAGARPRGEPLAALLDARRGEVYAAVYPGEGEDPEPLLAAGVYGVEELARLLPRPCAVLGEGVAVAAAGLRERLGEAARFLPAALGVPSAGRVGRLGALRLARGEGLPAARLAPRYLRRAEAEVRRTGSRFEPDAARGRFDTRGKLA